jgi:molybdate transport system substrate-binding protein
MRRRVLWSVLAILAAGAPGAIAQNTTTPLRIAAASDLRFALDEILTSYRTQTPGLTIEATYGSSGNFFAQLREGAPFDVFLSADADYTRRLFAESLSETPFPYAIGRLALAVRKESGLDPKGFGDLLKSPAIRRIAIANPAHAPYGRAAEQALKTWRVYDVIAPKLVFGDSVSQAAQFLDSGAAQAGLIALSLAKAKGSDLAFAVVPDGVHPPIEQSGVVMKRTAALEGARAFQRFVISNAGRTILERHGFNLPKP